MFDFTSLILNKQLNLKDLVSSFLQLDGIASDPNYNRVIFVKIHKVTQHNADADSRVNSDVVTSLIHSHSLGHGGDRPLVDRKTHYRK